METVASTSALVELLDAMYGPGLTLAGVMELLAAGNVGAQRSVPYCVGRRDLRLVSV